VEKKVTLIILEKQSSICFVFFFKKKYYVGMAQKKRVSEGQYSKKMLSIIDLLIFNTLMDSFMHA
jgi:hypothetical protein